MLGKGLESLIPQQDDEENISREGSQQDAFSKERDFDVEMEELDFGLDELMDASSEIESVDEESEFQEFHADNRVDLGVGTVPTSTPINADNISENQREIPASTFGLERKRESAHTSTNEEGQYIFQIEVDKIKPNPDQPRKEFDEEGIKTLAESIKAYGVIQPIIVSKVEYETEHDLNVRYRIVAGERRWRAARKANLPSIPAIIKNTFRSRSEKLELALIENVQRSNLSPIEQARAFLKLAEEFSLTQLKIAERVGKSREAVANAIRLLNLPPQIQEGIEKGLISESHAKTLLMLKNTENQLLVFREIVAKNLSVKEVESLIKKVISGAGRKIKPGKETVDPNTRNLINRLEESLGTKVGLDVKGKKGKIIIEFYSPEELKNIINKIT